MSIMARHRIAARGQSCLTQKVTVGRLAVTGRVRSLPPLLANEMFHGIIARWPHLFSINSNGTPSKRDGISKTMASPSSVPPPFFLIPKPSLSLTKNIAKARTGGSLLV